jgi:hypothetical protein
MPPRFQGSLNGGPSLDLVGAGVDVAGVTGRRGLCPHLLILVGGYDPRNVRPSGWSAYAPV